MNARDRDTYTHSNAVHNESLLSSVLFSFVSFFFVFRVFFYYFLAGKRPLFMINFCNNKFLDNFFLNEKYTVVLSFPSFLEVSCNS